MAQPKEVAFNFKQNKTMFSLSTLILKIIAGKVLINSMLTINIKRTNEEVNIL